MPMTRSHIFTAALSAVALLALPGCVASAAGAVVGTAAKVTTAGAGMAAKGVIGGVKLGARGANAVLTDDPAVPKRVLAQRAGRALGYNRRSLEVSDIYEDGNRTDYIVSTPRGGPAFYCVVLEERRDVSEAVCEEIPDDI